MKRIFLTLCLLLLAPLAFAQPVKAGNIEIDAGWARPTAAQIANGAAYLTIVNHGKDNDRLVSVQGDVAAEVQIHHTTMDGGMMRMRQMKDGVELPAGKSVKFAPGGYHIMLINLKAPLKAGEHFKLMLHFAKAGDAEVQVDVRDGMMPGMNMPMN
jgi:hypothetical protein